MQKITQNAGGGGCVNNFIPEGCIVDQIGGTGRGTKGRLFVTGGPNSESVKPITHSGRGSHRHGQGTFRRGSSSSHRI